MLRTVRVAQVLHFIAEIDGPDSAEEYGEMLDKMQADGSLLKLVLDLEPVEVTSNWTVDWTAAPEKRAKRKRSKDNTVCLTCGVGHALNEECIQVELEPAKPKRKGRSAKEIRASVEDHAREHKRREREAAMGLAISTETEPPSECAEPDCGAKLDALGAEVCQICEQVFCRRECLQVHMGDEHPMEAFLKCLEPDCEHSYTDTPDGCPVHGKPDSITVTSGH